MSQTINIPNHPASTSLVANITATLMVLAGIYLAFSGLRYIDPGQDELYQALCVRGYADAPLAMLTFRIGALWCEIFGDRLLALRSLMALCHLTSIGLGCTYFYHRTHKIIPCAFLFMLLSGMSTYTAMFIYNWDTGAYPFIVICLLATLYYMSAKTPAAAAFVGISSALMVLSRIPTICILPIFPVIIVRTALKSADKCKASSIITRDILIGIISFAVTATITIMLMCGMETYIRSWNPGNIITGHTSASDYLGRLVELGIPNLLLWGVTGLLYLASWLIVKFRHTLFDIVASIFSIITATAAASLLINVIDAPTADFGIAQGTLLITLLYLPLRRRFIDTSTECPTARLWVIAAFSLVAAVGSNGIAERPLALPLIPIACAYIYPYMNLTISCYFIILMLLTLKMSLGITRNNRDTHQQSIPVARFEGLKLSRQAMQLWQPVISTVRTLQAEGRTVRFWGLYKYHFQYAFNSDCTRTHNLYHYDENIPEIRSEVVNELSESDAVIFRGDMRWDRPCMATIDELIKLGFCPVVISEEYSLLLK
ncbi:hypothetical protein [uncultured Duncaniella sp.]|uniref:hypothetical protein n=1 Tax=uncultured Duncaniella sp. TaxID=2768039 RepID=UPI0025A94C95|nr:hypothetical protein [uncultured Duncaniella sp.]